MAEVAAVAAATVAAAAVGATKRAGCGKNVRSWLFARPAQSRPRNLVHDVPGPLPISLPGAAIMVQKRRVNQNKRQAARSAAPDTRSLRRPPELSELPRPVVYGKPFIVVEDADKNTFVFQAGNWVAYSASIAECR